MCLVVVWLLFIVVIDCLSSVLNGLVLLVGVVVGIVVEENVIFGDCIWVDIWCIWLSRLLMLIVVMMVF